MGYKEVSEPVTVQRNNYRIKVLNCFYLLSRETFIKFGLSFEFSQKQQVIY